MPRPMPSPLKTLIVRHLQMKPGKMKYLYYHIIQRTCQSVANEHQHHVFFFLFELDNALSVIHKINEIAALVLYLYLYSMEHYEWENGHEVLNPQVKENKFSLIPKVHSSTKVILGDILFYK